MMPSKKKKYNARFPAGRIKKIMQTDEEVGKVAQAVPIIISRTLELFVESLLTKSMQITQSRNAKTLTPSHMKQCILSESRFDFLKDLVKNIPDASVQEDNENNAAVAAAAAASASEIPELTITPVRREPEKRQSDRRKSKTEMEIASCSRRTPVIQYVPKMPKVETATTTTTTSTSRLSFSVESLVNKENKLQVDVRNLPPLVPALDVNQSVVVAPSSSSSSSSTTITSGKSAAAADADDLPELIPISHNFYAHNSSGDKLYIDEDYDN